MGNVIHECQGFLTPLPSCVVLDHMRGMHHRTLQLDSTFTPAILIRIDGRIPFETMQRSAHPHCTQVATSGRSELVFLQDVLQLSSLILCNCVTNTVLACIKLI